MKLCYVYIRLNLRSDDSYKNINVGPIYKYELYKWLYKGHKIYINKANINNYGSSIKYKYGDIRNRTRNNDMQNRCFTN